MGLFVWTLYKTSSGKGTPPKYKQIRSMKNGTAKISSNAKETFYFSFLVTPGGGQANWHKIPAFANSFCAPALTSTLTNLQGVQHMDHLNREGRFTHNDLYIDEELKDMCIFLEKEKRRESTMCLIWRCGKFVPCILPFASI